MNRKQIIKRVFKLTEDRSSYTGRVLDKLGGKVTDALVNKMIQDDNFDVATFFREQKKINDALNIEKNLRKLAEDRISGEVNGHTVDGFSAFMISRVLDQLTQEQKVRLLSKPTNEIIAIAYKLASRSEI